MVDNVSAVTGISPKLQKVQRQKTAPKPAEFEKQLTTSLNFSKHVSQRIGRRQLEMGPDRVKRLEGAVDKAASKGANDSLVLLDDLAVVVSVKNRTVITAMNRENMKEGVFTQIDSAIIV